MEQQKDAQKVFDKFFAKVKIIFLGAKWSIGTNISQNISFHDDKNFGPFFLVLSSVTYLKEHPKRVHKVF